MYHAIFLFISIEYVKYHWSRSKADVCSLAKFSLENWILIKTAANIYLSNTKLSWEKRACADIY